MADVLGRHAPPHARLTLALSGGLDSVALLHALLALRDLHPFELQAVHVHHGLSPHAD
ncbi:MAG: tRNA(Ile)-lysidine synthetase, partial [Thiobacillus sp.]|nr:tRNA(Ile)-lysidine synthetase [Thiobacillus sp.]